MPELPEVESLRRSLVPKLKGQKILKIQVHKPKIVSGKGTVRTENLSKVQEFVDGLVGETMVDIDRKAKNLIFETGSGKILLIHLKMTGQLVYQSNLSGESVSGGHPIEFKTGDLPSKHSHIIFTLSDGILYYNDTRMFGYALFYPNLAAVIEEKHFEGLGVDPFDKDRFTEKYFVENFGKLSGTVKKNFLEQNVVVGLGNIYADEVCFDAGIRPDRQSKSLKKSELQKLFASINKIIPLAVSEGGSSVANYLLGDGSKGNYANYHKVYKRSGKNCLVCKNTLDSIKHSGRTTVYCRYCQR